MKMQKLLVLSLGMDGVLAFKNGKYSVTPIAIKIWNLHPEERTSKGFVLLTALIPGPKKPKSFDPYLSPVLQEIKRLSTGYLTTNYLTGEEELAAAVLKTVEFDLQQNISTTENMGTATELNCSRCWKKGLKGPGQFFF